MRLIDEAAARRATRQFLAAHDADPVWRDAATLLAAEQALEFWAHRNNGRGRRERRQSGSSGRRSQAEEDAETASKLFEALRRGGALTNGMYSHVIDALARGAPGQVVRADVLLREFVALHVARESGGAGGPTAASFAPAIRWHDGDRHHFPNHVRITGVMRGHARHGRPAAAEALLDLMIALCSSPEAGGDDATGGGGGGRRRLFRPNEVAFATVVDGYSRVPDGREAERVLERMKGRHCGNGSLVDEKRRKRGMRRVNGANVVAYNAAISAWAREARHPSSGAAARSEASAPSGAAALAAGSRAAAERAERLLREMWTEHERWLALDRRHRHPRNTVLPDVVTYSTVISAYATCRDQPFGTERARELLAELEGLAAQEHHRAGAREEADPAATTATTTLGTGDAGGGGGRSPHGFRPNATVYNALLQAYANAGDAVAAEDVLRAMAARRARSLEEAGGGGPYRDVRPNARTLNVVLNAWSQRGGAEGGRRAREILERWERATTADGHGPEERPDVISYNTVLAAWSKSAGVDAAGAASEGEEEGALPKVVVGRNAAYEALKLLNALEQRHKDSQHDELNDHRSNAVQLDAISYNTTIAAFANAAPHCDNGTAMAEEAEAILGCMKAQSGIEPDDYSYNGVLLAWARSSGGLAAAQRAEAILRSMRRPTAVSWSTVVNAYVHADAAPKAATLLEEMERRAPTLLSVVLYNNVLHAWRDSSDRDASRNAVALLNRMEDAGSTTPRPDIVSYRLVPAWYPDKAARARAALRRHLAGPREERRGATTDRRRDLREAYHCVLAAATYTPASAGKAQRNDAARVLVETLRDMNQAAPSLRVRPDHDSYALFVQGCAHLFDPNSEERDVLLKSVFHECCQRGLLSRIIWNKFCGALQPEVAKAFVKDIMSCSEIAKLDYEELPAKWSSSNHST